MATHIYKHRIEMTITDWHKDSGVIGVDIWDLSEIDIQRRSCPADQAEYAYALQGVLDWDAMTDSEQQELMHRLMRSYCKTHDARYGRGKYPDGTNRGKLKEKNIVKITLYKRENKESYGCSIIIVTVKKGQ